MVPSSLMFSASATDWIACPNLEKASAAAVILSVSEKPERESLILERLLLNASALMLTSPILAAILPVLSLTVAAEASRLSMSWAIPYVA